MSVFNVLLCVSKAKVILYILAMSIVVGRIDSTYLGYELPD